MNLAEIYTMTRANYFLLRNGEFGLALIRLVHEAGCLGY